MMYYFHCWRDPADAFRIKVSTGEARTLANEHGRTDLEEAAQAIAASYVEYQGQTKLCRSRKDWLEPIA